MPLVGRLRRYTLERDQRGVQWEWCSTWHGASPTQESAGVIPFQHRAPHSSYALRAVTPRKDWRQEASLRNIEGSDEVLRASARLKAPNCRLGACDVGLVHVLLDEIWGNVDFTNGHCCQPSPPVIILNSIPMCTSESIHGDVR